MVVVYISCLQLVCPVSNPVYGLKQPRPLDQVGCQSNAFAIREVVGSNQGRGSDYLDCNISLFLSVSPGKTM
jgi:hypothetical protein